MSQALLTLRPYISHVLLALEVLLFLIGAMTLLTGRWIVPPRRYLDGAPAKGVGFILMMPMVGAFSILFALALWAHLSVTR